MSGSEDEVVFKINKAYAEKYDTWRRKEEYQQLLDKYGEDALDKLDESSSSEEEDDTAQEITPEFEAQFLKALASVKNQDPKIYDRGVDLFQQQDDSKNVESGSSKTKKSKPMFLKDYERQIIVEKGGQYSDDDSEDDRMDDEDRNIEDEMPASPTYVEEQKQLKSSFKDALKESSDEESDEETFLTHKRKTKEEKEREEEEYIEWFKGERQSLQNEGVKSKAKGVESLREYWSNPQLEEDEKFLRDYILDKAYKPGSGDEEQLADMSDEEDLSEDDRMLDQQEEFERKYNFRFEEPDSEFVKSYPRNVASSLRKRDTSRAMKRQEVKERKEKEKQKMREELKKLKNLKKMEIMEKLDKLKKVTGNATVGFGEEDMGGDFDPGEHDKMMQNIFDDQYDGLDEDATKPVFDDEEFDEENWDEWTGHDNEQYHNDGYHGDDDNTQLHCEDSGFNMDADYDPALHKKERKDKKKKGKKDKKRGGQEDPPRPTKVADTVLHELDGRRQRQKHTSEFAKVIQNKRPVFDPEDRSFEAYFEEYYQLDYEDLIGDLPCRFKYRTVVANDFGLSTEEMLGADDKELNRWASLRKTCQYRTTNEEMSDLSSFQEKGRNTFKKQQILQSVYNPRAVDEGSEDAEDSASEEAASAATSGEVEDGKQEKKKEHVEPYDVQENVGSDTGGADDRRGGERVDILANDLISMEKTQEKTKKKKKKRKEEEHETTGGWKQEEDSVIKEVNGAVGTGVSERNAPIQSKAERKKHRREKRAMTENQSPQEDSVIRDVDGGVLGTEDSEGNVRIPNGAVTEDTRKSKKRARKKEKEALSKESHNLNLLPQRMRVDGELDEQDGEVLRNATGGEQVGKSLSNSTPVEELHLKKHKHRKANEDAGKNSRENEGSENVHDSPVICAAGERVLKKPNQTGGTKRDGKGFEEDNEGNEGSWGESGVEEDQKERNTGEERQKVDNKRDGGQERVMKKGGQQSRGMSGVTKNPWEILMGSKGKGGLKRKGNSQDEVSKKVRKGGAIQDLGVQKRRWRGRRRKEISEGRLKAYGIRPTAYKYKLMQDRIKQKQREKKGV